MEPFDPPPGQPNPPPTERSTAPIGVIFGILLAAGVIALVGHYLGWF